MAIEEKQFIDEEALAAFWAKVETALTRMYGHVPDGKQVARVYQKDGRLHVEVEDFGGGTDAAKKAARASIGVGIYAASMTVADINSYTASGAFNHGDIVTADDSGDVDNGRFSPIHVNAGDSLIRCIISDGAGHTTATWQKLAYTTSVGNVDDPVHEPAGDTPQHGVNLVSSVTLDRYNGQIVASNRKVGLYCDGNRLKFG